MIDSRRTFGPQPESQALHDAIFCLSSLSGDRNGRALRSEPHASSADAPPFALVSKGGKLTVLVP